MAEAWTKKGRLLRSPPAENFRLNDLKFPAVPRKEEKMHSDNEESRKSAQTRSQRFFGGPSIWLILGIGLVLVLIQAIGQSLGFETAPWTIGIAVVAIIVAVFRRLFAGSKPPPKQ